jgi:hypothetical protein
MCFVVRKTTLQLEFMILTTLYLAGVKKHRQGYPDMILGDKPLISEVVLSQLEESVVMITTLEQ